MTVLAILTGLVVVADPEPLFVKVRFAALTSNTEAVAVGRGGVSWIVDESACTTLLLSGAQDFNFQDEWEGVCDSTRPGLVCEKSVTLNKSPVDFATRRTLRPPSSTASDRFDSRNNDLEGVS